MNSLVKPFAGFHFKTILNIYQVLIFAVLLILSAYGETVSAEQAKTLKKVKPDQSRVPRILAVDLNARLNKGDEVLIVDVRSLEAFKVQHISGAVSMPLKELVSRLKELPKDRDIVFY